jgi:hypothetical protein
LTSAALDTDIEHIVVQNALSSWKWQERKQSNMQLGLNHGGQLLEQVVLNEILITNITNIVRKVLCITFYPEFL